MVFTDRAIVLVFVAAVVLAVGLAGPVLRVGGAELGTVALALAAALDAAIVVLLVVDWRSLGSRREAERELVVRRRTEDIASQGVTNLAHIEIENHTPRPVRVAVNDTLPPVFTVGDGLPVEAVVPPGSRVELGYAFRPWRRGRFTVGPLYLRRFGRLGLVARQERRRDERVVDVYPDIYNVARSRALAARAGRRLSGLRRARVLGEGREFHRLRPYVQGDDVRLIDWKATAKHREPMTREFELERNQRIVIAVDAGRLMTAEAGRMSKIDWAVAAAMGLANVAVMAGDHVGLLVFSKEVRAYLPPRKGAGQFRRIVETLAAVEADLLEPDYAHALGYLAARMRRRSMVVTLTDLTSTGSATLVARLSALLPRHLPVCVTIRDRSLVTAAGAEPERPFDAYRAAAAGEVLHRVASTRHVLSSRGVLTVDASPNDLLAGVIDRYLDVKARGRL